MSYNHMSVDWGHMPGVGARSIWNRLTDERITIRFCENYITFTRKGVRYEINVKEISDGVVVYELWSEDHYRMTWDEYHCEGTSVWHAVADVMCWVLD